MRVESEYVVSKQYSEASKNLLVTEYDDDFFKNLSSAMVGSFLVPEEDLPVDSLQGKCPVGLRTSRPTVSEQAQCRQWP